MGTDLVHVGVLRGPVRVDGIQVIMSRAVGDVRGLQRHIHGLETFEKGLGVVRDV